MKIVFVVLAGLVALARTDKEIAPLSLCDDVDQSMCTIKEVRVDPCRPNNSCTFKKGKNATLEFDFVPQFSAEDLKTGVYWPQNGIDVPFAGFGSDDACLYTKCPTVANSQQLYSYTLHVGKKLPSWMDCVKEDMNVRGVNSELTNDRDEWKKKTCWADPT